MAPERANGEEPRPPVDLWSLGATLYAAVEGRPPFDKGEPMATLLSVVSEHPAPMPRAGPLEPVLRGLLTKDPAQRSTAPQAARALSALHLSVTQGPPPPAEPQPRAPQPVPGGSAARIDAADLRKLASVSRAVLGSVARDARDHLADRRRDKKEERRSGPRAVAERAIGPPPQRRRRFKRRWVVVPVLTTVIVLVLVVLGALVGLAAFFGLL
jgi:serine/threonine protein kinase